MSNSLSPLRVGVLGCGRIAHIAHLPALASLSGARLVAFADSDPEQLKAAAERAPGATPYTDYRRLLERSEVDVVVVCLPSALHAEAAIAAFEVGAHVYIEKPLATSLEDARALLDAHRRAGTVGAVGFNFRFGAEQQEARRLIRRAVLGPPAYVHTTFAVAPRALNDGKGARDGGALLRLGSHHVDLVPYLLGQTVEEVFAEIQSHRTEDDTAVVQMRLTGGVHVQSFFSTGAATTDRLDVYGAEGRLTLDRFAKRVAVQGPHVEYSRPKRLLHEVRTFVDALRASARPPGEPSYRTALQAFLTSVRTGGVDVPTLEAGARSLAILEAIEQSAAAGRPVAVPAVSNSTARPFPSVDIAAPPR